MEQLCNKGPFRKRYWSGKPFNFHQQNLGAPSSEDWQNLDNHPLRIGKIWVPPPPLYINMF